MGDPSKTRGQALCSAEHAQRLGLGLGVVRAGRREHRTDRVERGAHLLLGALPLAHERLEPRGRRAGPGTLEPGQAGHHGRDLAVDLGRDAGDVARGGLDALGVHRELCRHGCPPDECGAPVASACGEARGGPRPARPVVHRPLATLRGPGSVRRVTIWIDPPAWPAHGRLWSHLVSDTSYDELHVFAAAQGIPRRGFEGDHYDVPEDRYAALVAAGATPVDGREVVRILQRSGLRIQKRRHERVVQAVPGAPWLPPGSRADVIASRQDEAPANTVVVRLALRRGSDLFVVERADGGWDLPSQVVGEATPLEALGDLVQEVLGSPTALAPSLVGYVRNTVPTPDAAYPWPAPKACFAVYAVNADSRGAATPAGRGSVALAGRRAERARAPALVAADGAG